jgi:hypothetical protein
VILVDSNIPMYLVGAPHPHKADAQRLLERLITDRQRLVTDAEVLQEVLRRYFAIGRRDAIQPTFDALLGVVDQVLAVDVAVVPRAKQIVLRLRASWRSSKKTPHNPVGVVGQNNEQLLPQKCRSRTAYDRSAKIRMALVCQVLAQTCQSGLASHCPRVRSGSSGRRRTENGLQVFESCSPE